MKNKKIMSYITGTLMLTLGLILLTEKRVENIIFGISFLMISLIIYPIFDYTCERIGKEFSTGRKIALGVGTFLLPPFAFSSTEITYAHISTDIILLLLFWIIMFATNKKEFAGKKNKIHKIIGDYDISEFKKYSPYFYKCVSNILIENRNKYLEINDSKFPCFDIKKISAKVYSDIKFQNDNPLLFVTRYEYLNAIVKGEYSTAAYRHFKREVIKRLNCSTIKEKQILFNSNIEKILFSADGLLNAKLYNNCIVSYDTDKVLYGVGIERERHASYFEKGIAQYYLYFLDSIISAILIAYLAFLSDKVLNLNYNEEFPKIVLKMLNEVKDKELIYSKMYELHKEFYLNEYTYIAEENDIKIFVNMIDEFKNNDINSTEKKIIEKNYSSSESTGFDLFNTEIILMISHLFEHSEVYTEDELKNILIEKIKNMNVNSIGEVFDLLINIEKYVNYYNRQVKITNLKREKDAYLSGNFKNLKENDGLKKEYYEIETGIEFEKYLTKLFKRCGYDTKHTGKAGDQGCDLILKKGKYIYCVQAKYYTNPLGNSPVQEIVGSLKYYKGDKGVVITNSNFTNGAKELAKINDVILIDGAKLEKIIDYLLNDNNMKKDILKNINII